MKIKIEGDIPVTDFVKRVFFLLYEACGGPLGMGFLQARSNATEDQVWQNVRVSGDYPGDGSHNNKPQETYADYVFGRMIKWGVLLERI